MNSNRRISDLSANHIIREAVEKIAHRGIVSPSTGVLRDTGKVTGYVTKIHYDGELAGTVDVQEYVNTAVGSDGNVQGYHEGVFLSAIQNNLDSMVIIPKLYSEVVVTRDPATLVEYVTMFSHVDCIQLDSHEKIVIGVREREEFDDKDEDAPDVGELPFTGTQAVTNYDKDRIVSEVKNGDSLTQKSQDSEKISALVGDNETSLSLDKQEIRLKRDKSETVMESDSIISKVGGNIVKINDNVVFLGSESGTQHAVLGEALCDTLIQILDAIIQIKTTTQLGPQPPLNLASFIQSKATITQYKSAISGFLTKAVEIKQ